jgi:hypothetical protein
MREMCEAADGSQDRSSFAAEIERVAKLIRKQRNL